jgi:hypothetical protein
VYYFQPVVEFAREIPRLLVVAGPQRFSDLRAPEKAEKICRHPCPIVVSSIYSCEVLAALKKMPIMAQWPPSNRKSFLLAALP